MTSRDRSAELTDWIHATARWKRRQREVRDLLRGVEDLLRTQEESLDQALWMCAKARNDAQFEEADELMSQLMSLAQKEHQTTLRELKKIHQRLQAGIEAGEVEETVEPAASSEVGDPVDEASRESFPASDPPSFNPGRA